MSIPPTSGNDFRRPPWLFSRHLETAAAVFSRTPRARYQREIVALPDRDEIALDYILGDAGQPVVVLFHGLEGCSQSRTLRIFAAGFAAMKWSVAAPHFRSCGGQMNRLPRAYHAGDRRDVRWILNYCKSAFVHAAPLFAVGVSLGGNALIKHLANPDDDNDGNNNADESEPASGSDSENNADSGTEHNNGSENNNPAIVRAAVAVCAPHDLAASARAMDAGINRAIYARHFLKTLRAKVAEKRRRFPALCDPERLRRANTVAAFDELYTAPAHGFASAGDYWKQSSCGPDIPKVKVPLLCVNPANDPLVPPETLIPPESAPNAVFVRPRFGGHGGFIGTPRDWLFAQARDFFIPHCNH